MRAPLARTSDYSPGSSPGRQARYGQVVYLTTPAAAPTVTRASPDFPQRCRPGYRPGPAARRDLVTI